MKTLFLLLLFPVCAVAQVDLSVQACREMALQNSKEIRIADKQQQKAAYDVRMYRADYWPKISLVGLGLYNQKKYNYKLKGGYLPAYKPGPNGQLEPDVMIDPETHRPVIGPDGNPVFNGYAFLPDIKLQLSLRGAYSAGVQAEQAIYMGGKIRTANQMAKTGEEIATENVRLSRSEILLETDQAYWQLVQVEEQVLAARKYREVVYELLKNLQNAQAVGMSTANDVLKAQVRYNEATLMLQQAENGKTLARMNLCRLTGLDLQTEIRPQDSLTETVNPQIWMLDSAVSQRPDYRILEREIDLKERQVILSRSDFLPQVGVSAGYGYAGGLKLNGDGEANATFMALAAVKIPVFHWGEGRNKVYAARMEEEISRLNLEKSADLMQLQIASARFNLEDAQTRVRMAWNALSQARENLKVSTDQYDVGMETLTSLLEAQAQWQQAWSQWIDAKALLRLGESAYLKAIGKLEGTTGMK